MYKNFQMMKHFNTGANVETNEDYYKLYGRKMYGVVIEFPPLIQKTLPFEFTLFECLHQEGNINPEYQNNKILMMTRDLQLAKKVVK